MKENPEWIVARNEFETARNEYYACPISNIDDYNMERLRLASIKMSEAEQKMNAISRYIE